MEQQFQVVELPSLHSTPSLPSPTHHTHLVNFRWKREERMNVRSAQLSSLFCPSTRRHPYLKIFSSSANRFGEILTSILFACAQIWNMQKLMWIWNEGAGLYIYMYFCPLLIWLRNRLKDRFRCSTFLIGTWQNQPTLQPIDVNYNMKERGKDGCQTLPSSAVLFADPPDDIHT